MYEFGTIARHQQLHSLWERIEAGWVCLDAGKDKFGFVGEQVQYADAPLSSAWEVYDPLEAFVYLLRRRVTDDEVRA